jgi:hypothetical protein
MSIADEENSLEVINAAAHHVGFAVRVFSHVMKDWLEAPSFTCDEDDGINAWIECDRDWTEQLAEILPAGIVTIKGDNLTNEDGDTIDGLEYDSADYERRWSKWPADGLAFERIAELEARDIEAIAQRFQLLADQIRKEGKP